MKLLHQYPISTISVSDGTILNSFRFRGLTHSLRQFTTIVAILKFENGHLLCAPDSTRLDSTPLVFRYRCWGYALGYCLFGSVIVQPLTCDADQELKWKLKLNVAQTQTRQNTNPSSNRSQYDEHRQPSALCRVPCAETAVLKPLPIALGSNARGMRLKGG